MQKKQQQQMKERMLNQHNFNQMWFSNMGNPLLLLLLCNLVEIQLKVKIESPVMLTYALRS